MANKDWAFGLQPARDQFGHTVDTLRLPLKANYSTKIYKGSILKWAGTGYVKLHATTGVVTNLVGVAAEYYAGSATTKTDLAVWSIKPGSRFLIQSDGGTTSTNRASYLFENHVPTTLTQGNTITGLAAFELDFSSGSATATDSPLKVIGFQLEAGGTVAAPNPVCIVEFVHGSAWESDVTIT